VKVTLLGGAGFRTPLTFNALRRVAQRLGIHELVLHDLHAGRLRRMCQVLEGLQAESSGPPLAVTATTELSDAVRSATFVLCAIRVGGLEARVVDERVPLREGVVGQETVGPGGLCLVLRSAPIMSAVAHVVAREAPDAWLINFTNPVGVMSGVLRDVLGERVLGVCDTPVTLCRRVATLLGRTPAELRFDYFGLNHLGWLRSVWDIHNDDLLPSVLADDATLSELDEGQLFGSDCVRKLGIVPSEYLAYYYFPERQVQAVRAVGHTRAEYLLAQQNTFYAEAATSGTSSIEAVRAWRQTRSERDLSYMAEARPGPTNVESQRWSPTVAEDDSDGYAGLAVSVMESLATNVHVTAIVNTSNRGCLNFLEDDVFVELPCVIRSSGATARVVADVPQHSRELMQRVNAAEQAALFASRTSSSRAAIEAITLHPLVGSADVAHRIFSGYLQQHPDLAAQFA
jgi:6-phospho-beta-glucosidase